jgi:hypothetical protein
MVRGSLFAARCGFMGGNGGSEYQPPSPCNPGAGGDAVDLTDTTPAELYSCNFAVGQPGAGSPVPPPALKIKSNVPVSNVVWPKRMYQVSSPVREQQMIHLTFDLDVATDVYLLAAPEPGLPFTFGGVLGPSTIDLIAMGFVSLGTLPAGQTVFSIPSGDMPPTLMGAYLSTQPMYTNATLTYVELGNPSHLLLLDASF